MRLPESGKSTRTGGSPQAAFLPLRPGSSRESRRATEAGRARQRGLRRRAGRVLFAWNGFVCRLRAEGPCDPNGSSRRRPSCRVRPRSFGRGNRSLGWLGGLVRAASGDRPVAHNGPGRGSAARRGTRPRRCDRPERTARTRSVARNFHQWTPCCAKRAEARAGRPQRTAKMAGRPGDSPLATCQNGRKRAWDGLEPAKMAVRRFRANLESEGAAVRTSVVARKTKSMSRKTGDDK